MRQSKIIMIVLLQLMILSTSYFFGLEKNELEKIKKEFSQLSDSQKTEYYIDAIRLIDELKTKYDNSIIQLKKSNVLLQKKNHNSVSAYALYNLDFHLKHSIIISINYQKKLLDIIFFGAGINIKLYDSPGFGINFGFMFVF